MQRPSYKVFNYTLKPGEQVPIHHRANSLNCLSATGRFQIAFDDAPLTTFEKGLGYTAEVPFSKVRLLNDGDETIKIELGFASGGVTDSRLNLPSAIDANITNEALTANINGAVDANITNEVLDANITNEVLATKALAPRNAYDSKITAAPNSRTAIVGRNVNRREVMITNLGDTTVYLGGSSVADGEGLPIGAGKTASLQSAGYLLVWNPSATAIKIAVLELSA